MTYKQLWAEEGEVSNRIPEGHIFKDFLVFSAVAGVVENPQGYADSALRYRGNLFGESVFLLTGGLGSGAVLTLWKRCQCLV